MTNIWKHTVYFLTVYYSNIYFGRVQQTVQAMEWVRPQVHLAQVRMAQVRMALLVHIPPTHLIFDALNENHLKNVTNIWKHTVYF